MGIFDNTQIHYIWSYNPIDIDAYMYDYIAKMHGFHFINYYENKMTEERKACGFAIETQNYSSSHNRIGKSVHNILPEKIESHELSDKEQLQEYSFAPTIREIETMTASTATTDVIPPVDTAMISAIFSQEADSSSSDTSTTSSNIDAIAGNVAENVDEQIISAPNRRKREKEFESARELLFGENEF